ncbi:MAG: GNAT family N-acetyltransferase [Candidatus Thorarchaeota archaeon]
MVNLRVAKIDDIDKIRQHEYDYPHVTDDLLKHSIQNSWVYVVEVEGDIIGYARLEFIWLAIPYLALITLNDEHQGKGIGTSLIEKISQDMIEQGHSKIYTSSEVMEPEPQKFHRKCGFKECGIITGINDNGVGEIFFVKKLKESK